MHSLLRTFLHHSFKNSAKVRSLNFRLRRTIWLDFIEGFVSITRNNLKKGD
ncbi:MAG: hypothetical protein IJF90_02245 [Synergistaceae bacterium]|nr:hypothetical protein [Synergistaceae bacterium]